MDADHFCCGSITQPSVNTGLPGAACSPPEKKNMVQNNDSCQVLRRASVGTKHEVMQGARPTFKVPG